MSGLILAAAVLTGCGGKQENSGADAAAGSCDAGTGRITIATGNSTGVYYTLGGGLAQVISKNSHLKASAAETGASVQNIQQLVAGDYDVAFSLADTAADAVEGKGAFEGKKADVRALARIYPNSTQVVVRTGSGISSVADMKGKVVSTGSPKSGTEVIAHRLLEAAGLDPAKDVKAQRLDLTKTVDGMKDGRIDALVWSGGLPTPAMTDLFQSLGNDVRFVDISPLLPKMQEVNSVYTEGTIPKATYKTPADIKTIVVPNLLLVRSDMPESRACALTKLIFDHKADLVKVHPSAGDITVEEAGKTDPVQLHPGSQAALEHAG
jgi:uncharacterized protein